MNVFRVNVFLLDAYLHVRVTSDPAQFIHGQDIEALTEYSSLDLDWFSIPCQAKSTLPVSRDTGKPSQEGPSFHLDRKSSLALR